MSVRSFLSRKPVGLILRTFGTTIEDAMQRAEQVYATVRIARAMRIDDLPAFRRIDILVWSNSRYGKRADCGKTAQILRELHWLGELPADVYIHEVGIGDLFCGALNYGIAKQTSTGMDYSVILSPDVRSYLTEATMKSAIHAAEYGAKAVGVALKEMRQSVLEGRLSNTFCMWHNESLIQAGMFDDRAAMPVDERLAKHMRGWSSVLKENVFYPLAGVEEMFPLARMVDLFGPCLAPIVPKLDGTYEVPDRKTQPELWRRHVEKMSTKSERQAMHLASMQLGSTFLQGGILEQYRQPEE